MVVLSGNIRGTFREYLGEIQVISRRASFSRSTNVVTANTLLAGALRNIQGTFREHSGNIQGTFSEHSGNI
jgi:hypothetical protein